jgi:epsin
MLIEWVWCNVCLIYWTSHVCCIIVASSASQPKDGFFGEAAPSVPSSAPPAVAKSTGGIEDLFGDIGFEVVPVPATSSNHTLQAPSEDLFGESAFQAAPSSALDMFGAPAVQAASPPSIPSLFPPPAFQQPTLPAKSAAAESLEAFGSGGSNDNGGSMFPPPQASPAFDFAPNNGSGFSQGAMVLQSIGSTQPSSNVQSYSNNQASGNSLSTNTQQTQLESMQMQPSNNCSMLQPQQQPKKTFAPLKSTLWADTLSTGLVDLNIAGPKVNPLADLGIQLTDASLRNELWGGSDNKKKDERKSIYGASSMGQAMGVGSGLGRAGASVLPSPPLPPPAAMNVRVGMAPGVAPVTGMGPQMGLNPGMGMGVNLAMGMAPNMAPNMNMGMGQGVPNMWMGMGGYANQQYAGYR